MKTKKSPDAKDKDKKRLRRRARRQRKKTGAAKKSDEAGKEEKTEKAVKPVKIDLAHLEDRAVALPLPPGRLLGELATGKEDTRFISWKDREDFKEMAVRALKRFN